MSEIVLESNIDDLSHSTNTNIDTNTNTNIDTDTSANNDTKPKLKLDDRMKSYEAEMNICISPCESFVVRLDGRSFSKFTKKFIKPFDIVFIKAMCKTMIDLINKFDVQTGYTHSDEITLIFNSKYLKEEWELFMTGDDKINKGEINKTHLFDGRIQKILTLLSSYCSVRFNYHLDKLIEPIADKYDNDFVNLIKSHHQMFDARILKFNYQNKYEILNHQISI